MALRGGFTGCRRRELSVRENLLGEAVPDTSGISTVAETAGFKLRFPTVDGVVYRVLRSD